MVYVQHNLATWYNPRKAYMDPQTIDANKVMEVTMMKVDRLMTVSRVNGSSRISLGGGGMLWYSSSGGNGIKDGSMLFSVGFEIGEIRHCFFYC